MVRSVKIVKTSCILIHQAPGRLTFPSRIPHRGLFLCILSHLGRTFQARFLNQRNPPAFSRGFWSHPRPRSALRRAFLRGTRRALKKLNGMIKRGVWKRTNACFCGILNPSTTKTNVFEADLEGKSNRRPGIFCPAGGLLPESRRISENSPAARRTKGPPAGRSSTF